MIVPNCALMRTQLATLPEIDCTSCNLSMLAQNFAKKWGIHTRVQKREGAKANFAASAKTGWLERNSPTRDCRTCLQTKPRDQFVAKSYSCLACLEVKAAGKAEREAAKMARPAKTPPHCMVCNTHDVTRLLTRKNPSGNVGLRPICRDCYPAYAAEYMRARRAGSRIRPRRPRKPRRRA